MRQLADLDRLPYFFLRIIDLHSCRKDSTVMTNMTLSDIISLITISEATHAYHNHH
jgi:hypothetical protein